MWLIQFLPFRIADCIGFSVNVQNSYPIGEGEQDKDAETSLDTEKKLLDREQEKKNTRFTSNMFAFFNIFAGVVCS